MSGWGRNVGAGPIPGQGGPVFTGGGVGAPRSAMGGVYHPTPAGNAGSNTEGADTDGKPGVVSINPVNPVGTNLNPIAQLLDGLKHGLLGTDQPDATGRHGGSIPGSDVPIVGDLARFGAETVANVGGAVLGGIGEGLGAAAERIPATGTSKEALDSAFSAIPKEWLDEWQQGNDLMDKGIAGTGILSNEAHLKSVAIRDYEKFKAGYIDEKTGEFVGGSAPTLGAGKVTAPGSLADTVTNLIGGLELASIIPARGWADLETPGQGNLDRLDLILAVGDGKVAFESDKGLLNTGILAGDPTQDLNAFEKVVYDKVKSGDWTPDEARDALANAGQAYGHSAIANIGGSVALDLTNLPALGAAGLSRLGLSAGAHALRASAATSRVADARAALSAAETALGAAGDARALKVAEKALDAAKAGLDEALETEEKFRRFQSSGDGIRRINVLARAAEGRKAPESIFRTIGKVYNDTMVDTSLGRAAKLTRTLIDPLHAIDLRMPGANMAVNMYSDAIPRSVVETLGVHHYKGLLDEALRMDNSRQVFNQLVDDLTVGSTNLAREGTIDLFRSSTLSASDTAMDTVMAANKTPDEAFDVAAASVKQRDLNKWLRYQALSKVYQEQWSADELTALALGLERRYHSKSATEWLDYMRSASNEQRSLLKLANYGGSNRDLLNFVHNLSPDDAAKLPIPPGRMVLLARGTLSRQVAEAYLTKLTNLKSTRARAKVIREMQERFPSTRYVHLDPSQLGRKTDEFIAELEQGMDRLPMELMDDEIAALGPAADQLTGSLGGYKLGFRPEDKFLWGLHRDNGTGLLRSNGMAWVDHVADSAIPFRPAGALRYNIVGHPLVDVPVLRAGVRMVDHLDSAARTLKTQVTGAMVTEAARKRFITSAIEDEELAANGVTEAVARQWFDRITEFTREHQGYSGPRGFGGDDLYKAIKEEKLIPQPLVNGSRRLTPDDVMGLVLRAYDGDMRYIGLTQKLTARAKRVAFEMTGSNLLGQIAEHAWPTMKFRYNPIFQLQEKVEPWVLNAQRGVTVAMGQGEMTAADRATERLLARMVDNSLVRQGDIDQFEYSSAILHGKVIERTGVKPGTQLNRMTRMAQSLTDVQGVKRLNMLRTFRKGLGRELKAAWDESRPGDWEKMKLDADLRAGRVLSDDEFALQHVTQQMFANDILVSRLGAIGKYTDDATDWSNAIKTGVWSSPTNLGELQTLDLEHVIKSMHLTNAAGKDVTDLTAMRKALADGDAGVMNDLVEGLARHGADKDYIRRVENALTFSWGGFWKTAEARFGLTDDESKALQDMMAGSAAVRGMTPVEFISQVFSPGIIDGEEGILGHLEGTARLLREARAAGRKVKAREAKFAETRTQLAGKEGVSTREDFVRQLSAAFAAHLDPSAKRALLVEFRPELHQAVLDGKVQLDLLEVEEMWDELAETQLADRILGYMDGQLGTAPYRAVRDDEGVSSVAAGADDYMRKRGVEPQAERRYYESDDDFYERSAKAYGGIKPVEYERTGRKPTIQQVRAAGTELKPKPAGVDDRAYEAYQDLVIETRAQWDHITAPKSKGGMGIKVIVSRGDPYPDSAAMRADVAKGQLRVLAGDSDHPLMTNEQNVMFRAVHDIFGHAANGFEFGPRGELNAAIKHSQMYSDTAYAALLSETHGQTAYNFFSDDVIVDSGGRFVLDPADPVADYERQFPFQSPDLDPSDPDMPNIFSTNLQGEDAYGVQVRFEFEVGQTVGDDMKYLPTAGPGSSHQLLQRAGELQTEFPDFKVVHLDVPEAYHEPVGFYPGAKGVDKAVNGETWGADMGESIIFVSPDLMGEYHPNFMEYHKGLRERTKANTHFNMPNAEGKVTRQPRQSEPGVPGNFWYGPDHVMTHEFGHNVDSAMRPDSWFRVGGTEDALPEYEVYGQFVKRYLAEGRKYASEYSFKSSREAMAELFAASFNPNLPPGTISAELQPWVDELRDTLRDMGVWKPRQGAGKYAHLAGQKVRDVNKAARGTYYGPQRVGLLPQELLDEWGTKFRGTGKHLESNPDVARAAQMFGKWTTGAITNGLLRGTEGIHSGILSDIAGIPTSAAVPYNFTEAQAVAAATQAMVRKWDDAFRLQYFAQERSVLERSVNHPMFGLYPASYMWGKIMPELVRFIAAEPFGVKTGALAMSMLDVQKSIALRREYDAEFDAKIEELGHSQALSFGGFMLPTLPWDVSAAAPPWMRSIAEQGAAAQQAAEAGEVSEGVSMVDPIVGTFKKLAPLTTTVPWGARAIEEVLPGEEPGPLERASEDGTVQGLELADVLAPTVEQLRDALR